MHALNSVMRELVERYGDPASLTEINLEYLLTLPATEELERELVVAHQYHGIPAERERTVRLAEFRWKWGEVRDRIQAERPATCRCLGTGSAEDRVGLFSYPAAKRYYGPGDDEWQYVAYCACSDGQRVAAEQKARRERHQVSVDDSARALRWLVADIPPAFAEYTLDTYEERVRGLAKPTQLAALAGIRRWIVNRGRPILLIWGDLGVGKTGLAVSVLRSLIFDHGQTGLFMTAPELLDLGRQAIRDHDRVVTETLEALQTCPVLVVDDLGAERLTDWAEEKLFVLLNHRKTYLLRTILTTNLDPERLAQHFGEQVAGGERIAHRILNREDAEVVLIDGPNLRMTPKGET